MQKNCLLVLTLANLTLSLVIPSVGLEAIAQTTFGQTGQEGDRGRDGRSGRDGQALKIVVDGKPASYDLSGTGGEDGEDGRLGRAANSCEPPYRPEYSIIGASGGRGGDGGNGGRGGNGGDANIFYTDSAALQQLEIRNSGGRGGRNGRSARGGAGCGCREPEWQVQYCTIQTDRRPVFDANAQGQKNVTWQFHGTETRLCGRSSGEWLSDRGSYLRETEYVEGNWLYRRFNRGVSRTSEYTCRSGRDGETGTDGRNGETGSYGKITLIPRLDIPVEITSDRMPLSTAIGRKVGLVKNIWVERGGLSRLLRPSSDVPDRYTYLKDTARLFYQYDWAAKETPAALGVDRVEIGASVNLRNETAEIEYQLPGTLEYQLVSSNNLQIVKITGGFNPNRVSAFQLQSISGIGSENQVILSDRGNVRELLRDTEIEVQCLSKQSATGAVANDYMPRRSITFKVPPQKPATEGAIVNGSTYTLPVGRYCSPWLKANYDVTYQVAVKQTTKMGARYSQNISSAFTVGKN
ncbi:MAG: hypothetical protein DCE90_12605 [Pseudanabaena sp.]|nr:MAG: hypothetical protein DCE90_12605 [Pseudanabaena sp.]